MAHDLPFRVAGIDDMTAVQTVEEWQCALFGSENAYRAHTDILLENGNDQELIRLEQQWKKQLSESAGIPWHGWQQNVLDCARQRQQTNEAEDALVLSLIGRFNSARREPIDYWRNKDIEPNGPYSDAPVPSWYLRNEISLDPASFYYLTGGER